MRFALLVLGILGLAAPAWADACQEALTKAIAAKDARTIEAFFERRPEEARTFILAWRERLETDFAVVVVLKRQLKSIEEVEQGSAAIGPNAKLLAALKARLKHRIDVFEKEARFDAEALERVVGETCVEFSKREAAARELKGRQGGQPGTSQTDRRPPKLRYGTSAVLEMDGEPKPQPKIGAFKVVEAGKIQLEDPNYKLTATWDELPLSLGPEGKTIKLKITAWAKSAINTGVQIRVGGLRIERKDGKKEDWGPQPLDLPLTVEKGRSDTKEMTVHLMPSQLYSKGDKPWVSVGVFYGVKVDYLYKVANTGEN
ncbi:MAG: hypothetical protein AB7O88_25860 [Reyranellaceae bacterium]